MQKIEFRVLIKHPFKSLQRIACFESVKAIDFIEQSITIKIDGEIYKFHFSEVDFIDYTGLKDKNGKEIFEGDIVKIEIPVVSVNEDFIGQVKMSEGRWWVDNGRDAIPLWSELNKITVIGNIYENPELLEELQNGIK